MKTDCQAPRIKIAETKCNIDEGKYSLLVWFPIIVSKFTFVTTLTNYQTSIILSLDSFVISELTPGGLWTVNNGGVIPCLSHYQGFSLNSCLRTHHCAWVGGYGKALKTGSLLGMCSF